MILSCLLSCGRPELTGATARSFALQNKRRPDVERVHVDGGEPTGREANILAASKSGFETIAAPTKRIGQAASLWIFLAEAERRGAHWLLWLENDWFTSEPLPRPAFFRKALAADIETIRLYGERKMAHDGPRSGVGPHRMGTNERIAWTASGDFLGWQEGLAHWGCGGCLIRADVLARYRHCAGLKEIMREGNNLRSLRPIQNLVWHLGETTTAGFMP